MKQITIEIPIYFQTLEVIITEKFEKTMGKIGLSFEKEKNINSYESFATFQNEKIYLFLRKYPSPGLIAHECVHICNHVFNEASIRLDADNDEPYAYLMGWLVDEISNKIKP